MGWLQELQQEKEFQQEAASQPARNLEPEHPLVSDRRWEAESRLLQRVAQVWKVGSSVQS
jgi:hypothetical protein